MLTLSFDAHDPERDITRTRHEPRGEDVWTGRRWATYSVVYRLWLGLDLVVSSTLALDAIHDGEW